MEPPPSTPMEESSTPTQPPTMRPLTREEQLAKRDQEAIAYSKALLVEGDTLVYIDYPGNAKRFDSTGFEISAGPHKVHKSRLIDTGSKVFERLLGPTNQFRTLRRKGFTKHNLPPGINSVLDLTPPDEGDAAVELTAELSCSRGICLWYTAEARCFISEKLVGGNDGFLASQNNGSYDSPKVNVETANSSEHQIQENHSASSSPNNDESAGLSWRVFASDNPANDYNQAIQNSLQENQQQKPAVQIEKEVPEYCPVRHREGIARLLRVLECKDPRLDSAPKVWTLFALAKYFDCTSSVVDWIVTWMVADPNTRFIEILPEVSCKLAFGLKNHFLCRASFSILVGEEALSLASREVGHNEADARGTNQFGRVREDIDEDVRTRIEYASKNFASRVIKIASSLHEGEMPWLTTLPEYEKLKAFEEKAALCAVEVWSEKWLSTVNELKEKLRGLVITRVRDALQASLTFEERKSANKRRLEETYVPGMVPPSTSNIYESFTPQERYFTRIFWTKLQNLDMYQFGGANMGNFRIRDHKMDQNSDKSTIWDCFACQEKVNMSILDAIKENCFLDGKIPAEAFLHTGGMDQPRESSNIAIAPRPWLDWDIRPFATSSNTSGAADLDAGPGPAKKWRSSNTDYGGEISQSSTLSSLESQPLLARESNMSESNYGGASPPFPMEMSEILPEKPLQEAIKEQASNVTKDKEIPDACIRPLKSSQLPIRSKVAPMDAKNVSFLPPQDIRPFYDNSTPSQVNKVQVTTTQNPDLKRRSREPDMAHSRLGEEPFPKLFAVRESLPTIPFPSKKPNFEPNYPHWRDKSPFNNTEPTIPADRDMPPDSDFFNITTFLKQAKQYIHSVAADMLRDRDMGFDIAVTDTLLCLNQDEFKYLPLWAGGDDDDSGGVFGDLIPQAAVGPSGPGPSFHTAFSTPSAASSEFDVVSERTSMHTSVEVEDGFSDGCRRRVLADDDFHSETFSEGANFFDGVYTADKGADGDVLDRGEFIAHAPPSSVASSSVAFSSVAASVISRGSEISPEENDDMDGASIGDDIDVTDVADVADEENDDAMTMVAGAESDEEAEWDMDDTEDLDEAFDFGDGDEWHSEGSDDDDEEMVTL